MAKRQSDAARDQVPGALATPNDLSSDAVADISTAINGLLADGLALHLKTKNFHWHLSGKHFRDYHLLFDEQAAQIFAMTDPLAERIRKIGGTTLRSIGHVSRLQRVQDNDEEFVTPAAMLQRADERQQGDGPGDARRARGLRRAQGRGHGEPARKLHRRDRAAHLVPVRGRPAWQ